MDISDSEGERGVCTDESVHTEQEPEDEPVGLDIPPEAVIARSAAA